MCWDVVISKLVRHIDIYISMHVHVYLYTYMCTYARVYLYVRTHVDVRTWMHKKYLLTIFVGELHLLRRYVHWHRGCRAYNFAEWRIPPLYTVCVCVRKRECVCVCVSGAYDTYTGIFGITPINLQRGASVIQGGEDS